VELIESTSQSDPQKNSQLIDNRYEVVVMLEQSENEALFEVLDKSLEDEKVLLKVFHVSKKTTAREFSRFKNELMIARRLSHPNIGRVYDIGRIDSHDYYITMEQRQGHSLDEILSLHANKGLEINLAIDIFYRIALALNEAHSHGIIHRDLSPKNINLRLVENKLEEVSLNGFGHSKVLGENFGLTQTGEIIGTPSYMAPEQLRGDEIDHRVDVFALGTLAFEMFTGRKPYEELGSSPLVLMRAQQKLPDIRTYRPEVPEWIDRIVAKMLSLNPGDRYDSARDIINDLLVNSGVLNRKREVKKKLKIKKSALIFVCSFMSLCTIVAFLAVSGGFESSSKLEIETTNKSLIDAVKAGEETKVFQLLKKGANLHLKDSLEDSLVCIAAKTQNVNVLYTLLNHDQSIVNEQGVSGRSPLVIAVLGSNLDMVELLLNYGASVHIKDDSNKSPIDYAEELGELEILRLLKSSKT